MSRHQLIIGGAALLVGLALVLRSKKASAQEDSIEAIRDTFHPRVPDTDEGAYLSHVNDLWNDGTKCECADPKPGVYVPCDCSAPGAMVADAGTGY